MTTTKKTGKKMADFIPQWANAIAQFEGFNTPSSRPARNHNPGDLKYAGQPGAVGQDISGFAVFPDDTSGWQALYNQLQKYVVDFPGYSLLQIMARYLGQSLPTSDAQGNAFTYANYVASSLGVTASTTLSQLAAMAFGVPDSGGESTAGDPTGASGNVPGSGELVAVGLTVGLALWAVMRSWG